MIELLTKIEDYHGGNINPTMFSTDIFPPWLEFVMVGMCRQAMMMMTMTIFGGTLQHVATLPFFWVICNDHDFDDNILKYLKSLTHDLDNDEEDDGDDDGEVVDDDYDNYDDDYDANI